MCKNTQYLTLRRSLSGKPVFEHADVGSGAPDVDDDGVLQAREEGGSTHAVGGAGGEREDWILYGLLSTVGREGEKSCYIELFGE